jgi:hypothetical protein
MFHFDEGQKMKKEKERLEKIYPAPCWPSEG